MHTSNTGYVMLILLMLLHVITCVCTSDTYVALKLLQAIASYQFLTLNVHSLMNTG